MVAATLAFDGQDAPLHALELQRSLRWPVGQLRATLPPGAPPPDPGAEATCRAGDHGLFTGTVAAVERARSATVVVAEEPSAAAARLRLERSWDTTTGDQVIADLAGEAGMPLAQPVPPGPVLPSFTALRGRSALDHIGHLVRLAGCIGFVDAGGEYRVALPAPVPDGPTIGPERALHLAADAAVPGETSVAVRGAGALGTAGPGAEARFLHDEGSITAGDPVTATAVLSEPALRTAADVNRYQLAAEQLRGEATRAVDLQLAEVLAVDLGTVLTLAGFTHERERALLGPARVVGLALGCGPRGLRLHLRCHRLLPA